MYYDAWIHEHQIITMYEDGDLFVPLDYMKMSSV